MTKKTEDLHRQLGDPKPAVINNTNMAQQGAAPRVFTEDQFIELGLTIDYKGKDNLWRSNKKSRQIEKFRSSYRVHPKALERVWYYTQSTPYTEDRIDGSIQPVHFLVVYRWMNTYESELELHKHFGMPEQTVRYCCRFITEKIAALKKIVVSNKEEVYHAIFY